MNCRLCIHTNKTEGQIMNSCILPYVKSPECALEQRQASLGKHSVWAVLLPGCKYSPAIAKLGNISFSQLLKILSLAPQWFKIYKSRDSKYSLRNFSSFSQFFARHCLCCTTHLKPTTPQELLKSQHPVDQKTPVIPNSPQLWFYSFHQWHTD